MRAVLLLGVIGCGRIEFDVRTDARADTAADTGADADLRTCTTATFNTLPPNVMVYGNGFVSANGQLSMTTPGTLGSVAGIQLVGRASYAGWSTTIHIVTPGGQAASQNAMGWHSPTTSTHFKLEGGTLYADADLPAGTQLANAPFVPATSSWWRLREQGGTVFHEISGDGLTWSPFAQLQGFDLTDLQLDVGIATFSVATPADTAQFDDLEVCTP